MNVTRKDIIREDCQEVTQGSLNLLKPLKEQNLLITGGTGFIGTWLAEMVAFMNDNHDFDIKLILLSKSANDYCSKVPNLTLREDVTLIERDIRSLIDIPVEVNWIIHAAANPDNRFHASDPLKTIDVIVNGTKTLLEYANRVPELKKILNISSGQVYGVQPWDVNINPEKYFGSLDPSSLASTYPEAKRLAETLCTAYRNQHRLPIVNVRPFAFIGPYQLLDRPWAINNFIRDSLRGGPIKILGNGETIRSYMYPSDMAWWILNMLVHGQVGENYNLGSPHGVTLLQLADMIANQFAKKPKIVTNVSSGHFTRTKFVPDVKLAQKRLGLELKVDLENAIKRTILWNQ
jgi:nucleoside-diphosphate-sugar epimerase